jgi:hypothetical protein
MKLVVTGEQGTGGGLKRKEFTQKGHDSQGVVARLQREAGEGSGASEDEAADEEEGQPTG